VLASGPARRREFGVWGTLLAVVILLSGFMAIVSLVGTGGLGAFWAKLPLLLIIVCGVLMVILLAAVMFGGARFRGVSSLVRTSRGLFGWGLQSQWWDVDSLARAGAAPFPAPPSRLVGVAHADRLEVWEGDRLCATVPWGRVAQVTTGIRYRRTYWVAASIAATQSAGRGFQEALSSWEPTPVGEETARSVGEPVVEVLLKGSAPALAFSVYAPTSLLLLRLSSREVQRVVDRLESVRVDSEKTT
jgi:hypothetical protein